MKDNRSGGTARDPVVEVTRKLSDQFAHVEAPIIDDPEVDLYELAVYVALARHANADRECWPSMRRIAQLARCSPNRARQAAAALVDHGYLKIEVRRTPKGDRAANLYTLNGRGLAGFLEVVAGGVPHRVEGGTAPGGGGVPHPVGGNNTIPKKTTEQPAQGPFDTFWKAYPRKVNKAGALRAWAARMNEVSDPDGRTGLAAQIMVAVTHYTAVVAGKEMEYVMHPATFIGPARRWEDYIHAGGPRRVPSALANPESEKLAEKRRQEAEQERERVERDRSDPELVTEAEKQAAAFKKRVGLPVEA